MSGRLAWEGVLTDPIPGRTFKPRTVGVTFLSVKGLGMAGLRELIEVSGNYIDRVKLAFGTTLLLETELLREQIRILREADIDVNPGGTCAEIAWLQHRYREFLERGIALGFSTIEVSDGTIAVDDASRAEMVRQAIEAGFKVVSEVGKKDPAQNLTIPETIRQIERDLALGVSYVTIESRQSARGIGVFDEQGRVKGDDVEQIVAAVDNARLIWETPTTEAQLFFISRFGPNVNLGNIAPTDIIPCEGLRRGLRGDTFRLVAKQSE